MFDLSGKTALVFGAGSCGPGWSNGRAISVAYARAGARLVAVDHVLERAEETCAAIASEGGACRPVRGDVLVHEDIAGAVKLAAGEWGSLDILHCNVGFAPFGGPIDLDEETWDRTFAANVKAAFLACKYALPIMLEQGGGVVTSTSSILGRRVSEYPLYAYNASKAALEQFTKTLAVEYAAQGIRANCVVPGLIDTPQIHAHDGIVDLEGGDSETTRRRDARSPTGRQGEAWDVAHASVFLASDAARYVNGHMLVVDGGLTAVQA